MKGPAADWRTADAYAELLLCDRRAFAWEWLRRSGSYRQMWARRAELPDGSLDATGLLGWIDPALAAPQARPIWSIDRDPHVLRGRPAGRGCASEDLFDILAVAPLVSVAVDAAHREHWLVSDGRWSVRLDLNDGTLLGGPIRVEHRIAGIVSAKPKLEALRQFLVLAQMGTLPASMMPRERKAGQWILELRTGDALLDDASQQDIARALFSLAIAPRRWRLESASYRLRVQRLVRIARRRLSDPSWGPWFD
ncbi:DUF2285 domain-containing protein [Sphingopyxis sp. PAMC25046]|uniref:transcriptional regulator domain-containing protein n=1 Tax=Sphingopyxis sp. PAMC25046 TaxID=2565556 RepID=UPI00109DDC17|nr:DUF6499 domain-containing protein [Sphingopyxis sp. PAMC25046]QCB55852.1 DUF2285 domain-containing protein [Sphingopyxis sp. PAMC25046]